MCLHLRLLDCCPSTAGWQPWQHLVASSIWSARCQNLHLTLHTDAAQNSFFSSDQAVQKSAEQKQLSSESHSIVSGFCCRAGVEYGSRERQTTKCVSSNALHMQVELDHLSRWTEGAPDAGMAACICSPLAPVSSSRNLVKDAL